MAWKTANHETQHQKNSPLTREVAVQCPKCRARIGIYLTRAAVSEGLIAGISCALCGYWYQEEMPRSTASRASGQQDREPVFPPAERKLC
jgi:hypothetical protein